MRLGIVGGGQLGWMIALEAIRMGISVFVLEEDFNAPACKVAKCFKKSEIELFKNLCDKITAEFEHIDEDVINYLEDKLFPSANILRIKKSRSLEKELLKS
ncbi:MAG: 5-(carboxyamino)imidazole ribonucleotide synthase, partial [Aquificaceae bacterium]|nr:5-(carboxyamino)imidazole ribonucleotide synthase [Aquificaceae bacterium]